MSVPMAHISIPRLDHIFVLVQRAKDFSPFFILFLINMSMTIDEFIDECSGRSHRWSPLVYMATMPSMID